MRIVPVALAGLVAAGVLTANPAQADTFVDPDPVVAVQNFQGQIAELHDMWGTLSPDERSRRLKELQQVAPLIDAETRNLAPGQQLQVEGMLLSATFQLADLLHQL